MKKIQDLHPKRRSEKIIPLVPPQVPEELIEETLTFWQPYTSRVLTREDAREMVENVVGFFSVLSSWQAAEEEDSEEEDLSDESAA